MNVTILSAILMQLNPLVLPFTLIIAWTIKKSVGPDADPAYRAPEDTDDADMKTILSFFDNGQPAGQHLKYRLACNRLGANYKQPFASDHPCYGAKYNDPF